MKHGPLIVEMDRLSELPEDILVHILSFLPTKFAARTSLLSASFRRLWETCPVLDINSADFSHLPSSHLVDFANRILLYRNPPFPLHRLHLQLISGWWKDGNLLTPSYVSSLLVKACSLGLRHLTVHLPPEVFCTILPVILSFSSLESLSLERLWGSSKPLNLISTPTPVTLTHLKSLSIIYGFCLDSDELNWLLLQLNALENLNLIWRDLSGPGKIELKSKSLKRLKLVMNCCDLIISAPSLEFFEIKAKRSIVLRNFHGDMPLLRKAVMQFEDISAYSVPAICQMLMTISHVEELHLDIGETPEKDMFRALLVPLVDPSTFIRLKHFHFEICFHELNLVDLVTIIQHSPALDTLKLVHKPLYSPGENKSKGLWESMLPQNAEGNHRHAYFKDLHIAEKKVELLRKLIRNLG